MKGKGKRTQTQKSTARTDKKEKANVAAAKKKFGKKRYPSLYRLATPLPSQSPPPQSSAQLQPPPVVALCARPTRTVQQLREVQVNRMSWR